jgi:predicted PurR-regulated permease PerM
VKDPDVPETASAIGREIAALVALVLAGGWMGIAFLRPADAPNAFLFHPLVGAALWWMLFPFRRGVAVRHGVVASLLLLGVWIAMRLAIVWTPFLLAFLLAYLLRFVAWELETIHLPRGRVLHIPPAVVRAVLGVAGIMGLLLFLLVVVPNVVQQVGLLASGANTALREVFLYRVENVPMRDLPTEPPAVLGRDVRAGDVPYRSGTPLSPDVVAVLRHAGWGTVPIRARPRFALWMDETAWFHVLRDRLHDFLGEEPHKVLAEYVQGRMLQITEVTTDIGRLLGRSTAFVAGALGVVMTAALTLIILAYVLHDYDGYVRRLRAMLPATWQDRATTIGRHLDRNMRAFLRGQAVVIVLVAALTALAYALAGIPFAVLIGIMGGFFNTIPNIGAVFTGVFAFVVLSVGMAAGMEPPILWLLYVGGWKGYLLRAVLIPVALQVVQLVDNSLISPRVMSDALRVDPLLIVLAVVLGGALFGFWGVLLAVPGLVVVKSVWDGSRAEEAGTREAARGDSP